MGEKLSAQQRGNYIQVVGLLEGGWGEKFSKGLLKKFIHWLHLHFPRVSAVDIVSIPFWDRVGFKLTDLVNQGDTPTAKFLPLFVQIWSPLIARGRMQRQPSTPVPTRTPPSQTPRSTLGEARREAHEVQGSQDCLSLSLALRIPSSTHALTALAMLSRDLSHKPSTPVSTPKVVPYKVPPQSPQSPCCPSLPQPHKMASKITRWWRPHGRPPHLCFLFPQSFSLLTQPLPFPTSSPNPTSSFSF